MLKTPKIVKVEKFIGLVTIEGQESPIEIEQMTAYAGFPEGEFKTTFVALLNLPTKLGIPYTIKIPVEATTIEEAVEKAPDALIAAYNEMEAEAQKARIITPSNTPQALKLV